MPIHISNDWWWYQHLNYMGLNLMKFDIQQENKSEIIDKHNPVVNKPKYGIYLIDHLMVLKFYN